MKKTVIIALTAAAICVSASEARSFKRGVSENQFSLSEQMEVLQPGVSWYYNWGNTPSKGYQDGVINFSGIDFVPMTWNAAYNADNIREYVRNHPECKYLLGFNEPNFTKQANMTPQAAAQAWPAVQALAKELGLALVAPAMNYSPNPPYQDPLKWYDEFVALVGIDAFDYVAVHNYGGFGVMQRIAGDFHDRYGKDVWVTEFCYWPNEGQASSSVLQSTQIASMIECVEWLEKTPWIHRYAWFKPVGKHESTSQSPSPSYGLIISENGLGPRKLSPQGYVYVYMSEFDADVWHAENTEIPATEYINRVNAQIGPGTRVDAPKPIEISQFNTGAILDYQLDVPAEDDYNIVFTVSGQGEPVRFDPTLALALVDGDTETELYAATKYTLPGSDSEYREITMSVHLPAGHRTIRLLDAAPYTPSGIRISSLKFTSTAGVDEVTCHEPLQDGTVYTLDGRRAASPLAPGIYVRRGKKFIVR